MTVFFGRKMTKRQNMTFDRMMSKHLRLLVWLGLMVRAPAQALPDHHGPDGFRNLYGSAQQHKGLWPYIKMKYFDAPFPVPQVDTIPKVQPIDARLIQAPSSPLQVTWIGHASALVQIDGVNILTDPVFSDRASPVSMWGPRRYTPPAMGLGQLPRIDYVVISHNHYDHLDLPTVQALGNSVHWLVPLGLKDWFQREGVTRVTELDWWERVQLDGVAFTLTPTQHWSGRGLTDTNATLWGGWAIEHTGLRVWFGGDTGYAEPLFKDIGRRLGPFDLALIPIGGYGPRWFMREKHADPDDAVRICLDIGARVAVPIHWGAFVLTAEPIEEPAAWLARARQEQGLPPERFPILLPGQSLAVPRAMALP